MDQNILFQAPFKRGVCITAIPFPWLAFADMLALFFTAGG